MTNHELSESIGKRFFENDHRKGKEVTDWLEGQFLQTLKRGESIEMVDNLIKRI